MQIILNLLWIIFGGLIMAILWTIAGLLLCITSIGISLGLQCFKFAKLMLAPFGKVIETNFDEHPILNVLWIIFIGWGFFTAIIGIAVFWSITIIGIPIGIQWFKFSILTLLPFGAKVK